MSKVEELIQQLCPDGVEFKELGEVISALRTGLNPRQNFKLNIPNAKHYYVTVRELNGFSIQVTEKTDRVDTVGLNLIQNRSKIQSGDILFSGTGTIGRTALVYDIPINWNIKEGIYVITPIVNLIDARFLIYLIHSNKIHNQILAKTDGSTVTSISMASLRKIQIPVPPLPIQEEIVTILDKFTKLEAELEAELEARRKQYNYYRDQLLNFEGKEVEWKTLGEICLSITAGGDLPDNYLKGQMKPSKEFPYPIFANATDLNGLYGYTDNYRIESDAVTISARGAKIGFHTVRKGKFTPIIRLITLVPKKKVLTTKYLNYILEMTPISGTKGGIPQLTVPTVKKIPIPIPPINEQEHIVNKLDKFDALVNDTSVGLPAEIEARKKQFEYYREKLLTFKQVENG